MITDLTALVTGATSGLGFETAAQLAEAGYNRVTITGRSVERAEEARAQLVERTGRDVFDTLAVDFNLPESVTAAVAVLALRERTVDYLLLNAGMVSGSTLVRTDADIEVTFASSLIGHHQFTMLMLGADLLADSASIVIAGSEAARGDVPTMNLTDLGTLADAQYGGDLVAAAEALIRGDAPQKYKPGNAYANAKLFVAWWSAALARRLPDGITVNAVSPGSAPNTDAGRNAPFFMRRIMMPVFKKAPKRFGLAAPVSVAAKRYIDAGDFGPEVKGEFFASAPKKMTGPLHRAEQPHFHDVDNQEAVWEATVRVADADLPVAAAQPG